MGHYPKFPDVYFFEIVSHDKDHLWRYVLNIASNIIIDGVEIFIFNFYIFINREQSKISIFRNKYILQTKVIVPEHLLL